MCHRVDERTLNLFSDLKCPRFHSFRWEFFSEDGDIGFHIYYVDGDEKVDVIPWSRVDCHVVQEEGRVSCSRLTTCEFMQI